MPELPLCPDCRKQMVVRHICLHCGYDEQKRSVSSFQKPPVPLPYICAHCVKPAGKLVKGIPVCGDCFVAGWGRLDNMPLVPVPKEGAPEAPLYISGKPPKPKKARRTKKPSAGGK